MRKKRMILWIFAVITAVLHLVVSVKLLSVIEFTGTWGIVGALCVMCDIMVLGVFAIVLALELGD